MTGSALRLVTAGDVAHPLGATMQEWADGRYRRQEISANTHRGYGVAIRRISAGLGADTDVASITEEQVERWLGTLKLAPRSRNVYVTTYRLFFAWALRRGLVAADPFAEIRRAKVPKQLPRRVKTKDVERIMSYADFRVRVLLALAVGLGLRRSEMSNLDVEDFDPVTRTLLIRNSKGGKDRLLPVEGEPYEALRAWLSDGRTTGPMFTSYNVGRGAGKRRQRSRRPASRLSGNSIYRLLVEAGEDVGLTVSPHQFRHTHAFELLEAGASIEVVRRQLGHEDISVTGRYLHAQVDDIRPHVGHRSYYRGRWGMMATDDVVPPGPDFS